MPGGGAAMTGAGSFVQIFKSGSVDVAKHWFQESFGAAFARGLILRHLTYARIQNDDLAILNHGGPGKAAIRIGSAGRGRKRHRQVLPVDHVRTDCMRPVHVTPIGAVRVVLVEHVVIVLPVDRPIRVIHPVGGRQQMELRAQRISFQFRRRHRGRCPSLDRTMKRRSGDRGRGTEQKFPSVYLHWFPRIWHRDSTLQLRFLPDNEATKLPQ